MTLQTLYRPVGLKEMELILQSEAKEFPPRLPEQPIFYPVLNKAYAEQIARDWNTKDANSGFVGFVTAFDVNKAYLDQFEEHVVGSAIHQELWIPAEELAQFNQHISGKIRMIEGWYGENFKGSKHWYQDWYAKEMFIALYASSNPHDFSSEITLNRYALQINFKFWVTHDFGDYVELNDFEASIAPHEKIVFLNRVAQNWKIQFPDTALLGSALVQDSM